MLPLLAMLLPQRPEGSKTKKMTVRFHNVTVMNNAALGYLEEVIAEPASPEIIALVAAHLLGADLNAARRRIKNIGWRPFANPAITKAQQLAFAGEAAPRG